MVIMYSKESKLAYINYQIQVYNLLKFHHEFIKNYQTLKLLSAPWKNIP